MIDPFYVAHLDTERLLREWRWLCPGPVTLEARTAYGDLFLRDSAGQISLLDVAVGELRTFAASEADFRARWENYDVRREAFAEADEEAAAARGLAPNNLQCIAFTIPTALAESGQHSEPYLADIYECVAFLGDMHRQIATVPDGGKVRMVIAPADSSK